MRWQVLMARRLSDANLHRRVWDATWETLNSGSNSARVKARDALEDLTATDPPIPEWWSIAQELQHLARRVSLDVQAREEIVAIYQTPGRTNDKLCALTAMGQAYLERVRPDPDRPTSGEAEHPAPQRSLGMGAPLWRTAEHASAHLSATQKIACTLGIALGTIIALGACLLGSETLPSWAADGSQGVIMNTRQELASQTASDLNVLEEHPGRRSDVGCQDGSANDRGSAGGRSFRDGRTQGGIRASRCAGSHNERAQRSRAGPQNGGRHRSQVGRVRFGADRQGRA